MNKAVELLNDWIRGREDHLAVLEERAKCQNHWTEHGDEKQSKYYKPRYEETKKEIGIIKQGLTECRNALDVLNL